jgi:outer membrane biosynthesis protein TonB
VLKKVLPDFPQEAIDENILQGSVKLKVQTDAQGHVNQVQVLDFKPPKGKVESFELQLLFAE